MKIRKPEIFFSLLSLGAGFSWIFASGFFFKQLNLPGEQLRLLAVFADTLFIIIVSAVIYFTICFYRKRFIASELKYRILADTSPLPMWIFDIDADRFLLVNKAMIEKYGYTRKELLSMSPVDIRPAEEVERFVADVRKRKEGVQDVGIWTHKKKNGELFMVQVRTNKILYRRRDCFLVIADDISDLVEKEAEIKRLSLVARHAINGIIITGKNRKTEWVNDAFISMTGYSFNEVIGKMPAEFLHGEATDKITEQEITDSILNGKEYSGEILNYRKDGTKMWVQTTISPVEIDGKTDQYVAIFLDITDKKEHEEMIRLQNKKLKDIAFASSHLIRAPLANILGLTNLLEECDETATAEIIGHLKSSAQKLDDAVKEMVTQANRSTDN